MRIVGEFECVRHHDQVERVFRERQAVGIGNQRCRKVIVERPARYDPALGEKRAFGKADLQRMEPENIRNGPIEVRLLPGEQILPERRREPRSERC